MTEESEGTIQTFRRDAFDGKTVLVTGSSGFLASSLIAQLALVGCRLMLVRRPSRLLSEPPDPEQRCEFLPGSINDREFWKRTLPDVDFVFHFAAQTSASLADQGPLDDWHANVEPMLQLLEACREGAWCPGILFSGSVTESGIPICLPVDETHADRPLSIYDWHKLLCEGYLEHYTRQGWVRGATLRLANVYGPGPASGAVDRGILNRVMRSALRGGPLVMYGSGTQLRDYLFVSDAVEAFLVAAAHLKQLNGRHFVLGSGIGYSLAEAFALVAERAERLTGREVPVIRADPPSAALIDERSFVANTSAFCLATSWHPRTNLAEGIDMTLRSYLHG